MAAEDDKRGKKSATRYQDENWSQDAINKAAAKALSERAFQFEECIVSYRTSSQQIPQMNITHEGRKYQALCKAFTLLSTGARATHYFMDISHRCGNRFCIRPEHLLWEMPWDNQSRMGCHDYGYWNPCPHVPPCLPKPDMSTLKEKLHRLQHPTQEDRDRSVSGAKRKRRASDE